MDDAGHRAFEAIADGVGILGRVALELADIRHELPRDRIVGVGDVDQLRHGRRHRHRIARADRLR